MIQLIIFAYHLRSEWCWYLFALESLPVYLPEEGMGLDLSFSDAGLTPQPTSWVLG